MNTDNLAPVSGFAIAEQQHAPATVMDAEIALNHVARRAGQLYSLPSVALEVLELTQQPQIDIRALKECVENDPALTGKVLRVVNSALFGLSREVSDLNHALTMLGIKPLKLLVLGFTLSDAIFSKLTGDVMQRYWRHSVIKAIAARELSETLWHLPGDEPFLVALLQDLGLLVLLQTMGKPYAEFVEQVWSKGHDLHRLERQALGFDHRELTSRMLRDWGLPEVLTMGVLADRREHEYVNAPAQQRALPHILRMAELLANVLVEQHPGALERLLAAESPYPLSKEKLHELAEQLQAKVEALSDVFSLELPAGLDYRDVLASAHAQLTTAAEQAAYDLIAPGGKHRQLDEQPEADLLEQVEDLTLAFRRGVQDILATENSSAAPAATLPPQSAGGQIPAPARPSPAKPALASSDVRRPPAAQNVDSSLDTDPELHHWLWTAVAACRQSRLPLSVAVVELDDYQRLEREQGQLASEKLTQRLGDVCPALDAPAMVCLQVRQARFALILPGWDRHQSMEFYSLLLPGIREITYEQPDGQIVPATVSVGLAAVSLAPKNFAPQTLLESAMRCLVAAQRSGGNTLKSIGIY